MRPGPSGAPAALAVWIAVLLAGWTPALHGQSGAIDQAVAQLTREAEDLDQLEEPENPPEFSRPHPTLKNVDGTEAAAALQAMQGDLTGNSYRDAYIRWHLIWVAKQAAPDTLRDQRQAITRLLQDLPEAMRIELQPERRYVPPDLWSKYWRLRGQTRVAVGYPPFQEVHYGQSALQYMSEERRKKMQPIVEQMRQLRSKLDVQRNPEGAAFNNRVGRLDWLVRQYRGDLIHTLMLTRDPAVLGQAMTYISRAVTNQDRAAFDLLAFAYLAALDGVLHDYPASARQGMARQLKGLASRLDSYVQYTDGGLSPRDHAPFKYRNVAEYAFHLVNVLEEGPSRYLGSQPWIRRALEPPPDTGSGSPPSDDSIAADRLDVEMIRRAIRRASDALYNIEPEYTFRGAYELHNLRRDNSRWQRVLNESGNHALALWAMREAGELHQMPHFLRRLNWVLTRDSIYTFDRAMRMQLLAQLPDVPWKPYLGRDARWLTRAINEDGTFPGAWRGSGTGGGGDHANAQYGALALRAAQTRGVNVPRNVWGRIDRHWREAQRDNGGWALAIESDASGPGAAVSGPMTAGGTAVLATTERELIESRFVNADNAPNAPHLDRGLNWLDRNFAVRGPDSQEDFYYYMWTVQQVGQITGRRQFNGIDWFREVTAKLLAEQTRDGTWNGPKGKLLSTGFALLYLARANDPLPIAKVRHDGQWNRRPHDLLNFVEWAGGEFERPMAWQIVDADLPLYQLLESSMLYLSSPEGFDLSEAEVRGLKQYLDAGGLLLLSPERRGRGDFTRSANELLKRMYGEEARFSGVDNEHWAYTMHYAANPTIRMQAYGNGIRPLVIMFNDDLSASLQAGEPGNSPAFDILANLYAYVTGKQVRRARLDTNFIRQPDSQPADRMTVVRLLHDGNADPEPHALRRLAKVTHRDHGLALHIERLKPEELGRQPVAFMSVTGDVELTEAQVQAIRQWADKGGTLWLDPAGGGIDAVDNVRRIVRQLYPGRRSQRVRPDHPLMSGAGLPGGGQIERMGYRVMTIQEFGSGFELSPQVIMKDDQPAVVYTFYDLTTALVGLNHWGIHGYSPSSAMQLVTNGLLAAKHGLPQSADADRDASPTETARAAP